MEALEGALVEARGGELHWHTRCEAAEAELKRLREYLEAAGPDGQPLLLLPQRVEGDAPASPGQQGLAGAEAIYMVRI